ncbi:MAG: hypothetical protein AB1331_10410 [Bacillota bacterium]
MRKVEDIIDELADLIADGARLPFGKVVVSERELSGLLEELRRSAVEMAVTRTPAPVEHRATEQVNELVRRTDIVREAERVSREIVEAAERYAADTRRRADRYALDVLKQLEGVMGRALGIVREGRVRLDLPTMAEDD